MSRSRSNKVRYGIESYLLHSARATGGNRVELLRDEQIIPQVIRDIQNAKRFVHVECYIFRSDRTGYAVANVLLERAAAGVEVRVIHDAVGSVGDSGSVIEYMRAHGVKVHTFRPLMPWSRGWRLSWLARRDHRKIVVVDGQVGFTGGANVADEYAGSGNRHPAWHDAFVRIEGPAVRELGRLFLHTWRSHAQERPRLEPLLPRPPHTGDVTVEIIGNQELRNRLGIYRPYIYTLKQAKKSILIANAYFIPGRAVLRALRNAAARGVEVVVMLPARSDVPIVQFASQALYEGLLKSGVRIVEWPRSVLHSKTAVVDGVWSSVGSYNLDVRSVLYNLEVSAHMLDPEFGAQMEFIYRQDMLQCHEVRLQQWKTRPFFRRLLEWFFFQFRNWL